MLLKINYLLLYTLLFISAGLNAQANQPVKSIVGIDEQLGEFIPGDLKFTDDRGSVLSTKEIFSKPTILMFVYFECPGLCTPLMSEVAEKVAKLELEPGKDYQIVSVSFDPNDSTALAARKKANYISTIKREFPESAWKFMTGDSNAIAQLTDAVGFRYKKEDDQYIHAGALIMVSGNGKITRYLLGTEFLPFDMKMALIEAAEGRATPTIAKVLKFCFKYDAAGKKYALNVTRIFGTFILLGAGMFLLVLTMKKKKKPEIKSEDLVDKSQNNENERV